MELRTYLAILWRRKWVIAVTVVVTVVVVVVGTLQMTPKYVASTTLRVTPATGGSAERLGWSDIQYADRLMSTYSKIATSGPVLEELRQRFNLEESPHVEVEIPTNTELVIIAVENSDPHLAAEVANTLAEILMAQIRELQRGSGQTAQEILRKQLAQIEEELNQTRREYENLVAQLPEDTQGSTATSRLIEVKQQTYTMLLEQYERVRLANALEANTVSIIEPAVLPEVPSKPRKEVNIALGIIVGLIGGLGLAFLFENLDTRLYTMKQIETVTELPILGQIPKTRKRRQFTFLNGNSPEGEAFRRLRTSVFALRHNNWLPQTLLVTSAEPGEGKSTTVANLAYTVAQAGRKILVVDGDLRLPTLHKIFDVSNELGLSTVLAGESTLAEAVQDSNVHGIKVLTSGPLPVNPAELLSSSQMTSLIKQTRRQFDLILLDTPALLAVTDATILASMVDGVMLVVGRAQVQQESVQAAGQQLVAVNAKLIGAIINRAEQNNYHRYYRYYQRSTRKPK